MKHSLIAILATASVAVSAAEISLETAPPVVVKTIPEAGATHVSPALKEIRVTFSKPMEDGSWSWSSWGSYAFPETTGDPYYLPDGRTCVLPVRLEPGRFYATWLNSERHTNFKDAQGRPAVPYLLAFQTGPEDPGATLAPAPATVAETRPDSPAAVAATAQAAPAVLPNLVPPPADNDRLLNEDQQQVLAWTNRRFGSFFDNRTWAGLSDEERRNLEARLLDTLNGPHSHEYYRAINTLCALRSPRGALRLREIALERVDRNNRDRWMSVRALGLMGDTASIPDLIHLLYHGNVNTRWWAQISLVRLTGENFGGDWEAWGKWWNERNGQPPYNPVIIRWWPGQPDPANLAPTLKTNDLEFLKMLTP